jgi:TetR/AcrR family transcriptional repressor of nem operon
MRYPPEHKAEVHQKIVKDASRRIRNEGITGAAVSAVMQAGGLTHGGFYKHFGSKDELLMESLSEAFQEMADHLAHAAEKSKPETAWKAIVKTYLSLEYCEHVEYGCPLPALAPELARSDKAMSPGSLRN